MTSAPVSASPDGAAHSRVKKPSTRRLTSLTALITTIAVVLSSSAAWVLLGGIEAAQAGTLGELRDGGQAGSWRSVSAPLTVTGEANAGGAQLGGFAEVASKFQAEDPPSSWVVQVTARSLTDAASLEIRAGESGVSTPLMRVAAGASASVTTLVNTEAGAPVITSNAEVELEASVIAYLLAPDASETAPAPGGSIATRTFALIDTEAELGLSLEQAHRGATLSPLGLGGVPRTGVKAVWLQVVASGDAPEVRLGLEAPDVAVSAEASSGAEATVAQGLILVPIDADGQLNLRASTGVEELTVALQGWVADSVWNVTQGTIDGGLIAGGPFEAETEAAISGVAPIAPDAVPAGALSLFSVQFNAGEGAEVGSGQSGEAREFGVSPTHASVAGATTALVVAQSGEEAIRNVSGATTATWFGYFVGSGEATDEGPQVEILTPAADSEIDLGVTNGLVTFSGTAKSAAGLVAVHVKRQNRFIGSADIRFTPSGYEWSYSSSVPFGAHDLTVEAVDQNGATGSSHVAFSVRELTRGDIVVAENIAVIGDDLMRTLARVTPTTLTFDGEIFVKPGDIVTLPVSELTPDGALRRVEAVQRVSGSTVVTTSMAAMADVLLNGRVTQQGEPVNTDPDLSNAPSPAVSAYVEAEGDHTTEAGSAQGVAATGGGSGTILAASVPGKSLSAGIVQPYRETSAAPTADPASSTSPASPAPAASSVKINELEMSLRLEATLTKKRDLTESDKSKNTKTSNDGKFTFSARAGALPTVSAALDLGELITIKEGLKKQPKDGVSTDDGVDVSGSVTFANEITVKSEVYFDFDVMVEYRSIFGVKVLSKVLLLEMVLRQVDTNSVKASVSGEVAFGVSFKDIEKETKRLTELRLGTVIVPLGPVPVPVSLLVSLELSFEVALSGELQWGTTYTSVQSSGFRYENGRVSPVGTNQVTRDATMHAELALEASVGLTPAVEMRIAESVGGYFKIELKLIGTVTLEGEVSRTESEGDTSSEDTGVVAGAQLELLLTRTVDIIFGLKLSVFGFFDLFELSTKINVVPDKPPLLGPLRIPLGGDQSIFDEDGDGDGNGDGDGDATATGDTGKKRTGSGGRPLALVIDVSGSMAGERIERARDTLLTTIERQQPGTQMGAWAYPGGTAGSNGCSPGDFIIPMSAYNDTAVMKQGVLGLTTGGNTPTGEALRAVVNSLEQDGHDGASILLVTDGESNCGVDPAQAADEILAKGFDLTVSIVVWGNVDAGGLEQVADTTGGRTLKYDQSQGSSSGSSQSGAGGESGTDAEDELFELIQELSMPSLEVSINVPSTLQRGDEQRVQVTLSNTSARDVTDATFMIDAANGIEVSADPASMRVGNIPVGASLTREVVVSVGETVNQAELSVRAWGANTPLVEELAGFTVHEPDDPALDPKPDGIITETDRSKRNLLVLGDAALTAAAGDELVASDWLESCTHGETVAGQQALGWDEVIILACAEYAGLGSLQTQLRALDKPALDASSVMLSVGAAEIGLSEAVADCLESACDVSDPAYQNAIWAAQQLDLTSHFAAVWASLNGVGEQARSGNEAAPLLVAPYPLLFPEDRGLQCTATIGSEQTVAVNLLITQLNLSIAASVERARELGVEAYYLADNESALQNSANLCGEQPGITSPIAEEFVALTEAGATRVSRAIATWSESRARQLPSTTFAAETGERALSAATPRPGAPRVTLTIDAPRHSYGLTAQVDPSGLRALASTVVMPGQIIEVQGSGYDPGSKVYLSLQLESVAMIGHGTANDRGEVRVLATVPTTATTGAAELSVLGLDEQANSFRAAAEISIGSPVPPWVAIMGALTVLTLLAALVLWLVALRRPVFEAVTAPAVRQSRA